MVCDSLHFSFQDMMALQINMIYAKVCKRPNFIQRLQISVNFFLANSQFGPFFLPISALFGSDTGNLGLFRPLLTNSKGVVLFLQCLRSLPPLFPSPHTAIYLIRAPGIEESKFK